MKLPIALREKVISEFPNSTIFLAGCSADGCRRDFCEYNIFAYPAKGKAKAIEHNGQLYLVQPASDFERIIALPYKILSDIEWNMAKVLGSRVKEKAEEARKKHVREVEVIATSDIIESFSLLEKGKLKASSLYFVSSLARISELMLLKEGTIPHPSHIASQLRERSLLSFFSEASDFDFCSNTNAERRMHKISAAFGHGEAIAIRRKMKGLIDNGNVFDSLFYSYWCISNLLLMRSEGAYAIAESMNIIAEEKHLKRYLPELAERLKQLIKQT